MTRVSAPDLSRPRSTGACLLLALFLLVPACSQGPSPEGSSGGSGNREGKPAAAEGSAGGERVTKADGPSPLPRSGVVAVVNGQEISEAEYAAALTDGALRALPATPQGRRKVLDMLIEGTLIFQDAVARGVRERPLVRQVIERYGRQTLASQARLHLLESVPPVTEAELDKEVGKPQELVDMTLFLTDELDEAQAALARIAAGARFEEVAVEVNDAPGSENLDGPMRRKSFIRGGGMYPAEVEDAVFAVPKGQISAPIRTPVGFLVVRIDDRRRQSADEYQQVRAQTRVKIEAARREKVFQDEVSRRRGKSRVEFLVEDIDRVSLPDTSLNVAALWREIEKIEVARVDGLTLTLGDVVRDEKHYGNLVKIAGVGRNVTYRKDLEAGITDVLLAGYGREKGLDKAPWFSNSVDGFAKRVLQSQNVNDIYLGIVEEDLDEEGCRAFFKERSFGAKAPELLVLSHILVRREAEVEKVLAHLRIQTPFEQVAREYSVASTAAAGGDVGPRLANELGDLLDTRGGEELLGKARGGERGPIVIRTTAGFNVFLVRQFKAAGTAAYEDLRLKVRPVYLEHCRQQAIRERVTALREKAVIFIDDEKVLTIPPSGSATIHGGI